MIEKSVAAGSNNIIGEPSSFGDNFFNNYYHGLESDNNYGTIAENNSFQECLVGVHFFNVDVSQISENYISNYTLSPQVYQDMKIGIDVEGTGTEASSIDWNYVLNYTTGIHVRNIPKANVGKTNNIFIMTSNADVLAYNPLTLRGIYLENCPNSTVVMNEIYRFEDPDPAIHSWIRGIEVEATQSTAVYGNNVRKSGAGIQLFSVCTGTQLLCNVMLDCFNGVFLNCTYSDQGSSTAAADNYWNNQIDPTWFRVDGNANTVKWFYDATVDNNYNPNPHFPGITDVDNTPHSDCPDPTIVHLDPGDALRSIADGSIDYEDFQSEMTYSDQQFFYEKLKEDSVLMYSGEPTDSLFQALYNQLRSGNIGLFSGVKDMIRNYDFAQAYIRNQQIVDSNLMETNKRTVMEIFLYCKIHDTVPDSAQIATLSNIAYQYPPAGGEAVYLARAILGLHIEDNLPLLRKGRKLEQAYNSKSSFGRIYPNPASNNFYYQLDSPLASIANMTFELTDAKGRAVLKQSLKGILRIQVNSEKLVQGVYYYRVLINNVEKDRGKVVIIK